MLRRLRINNFRSFIDFEIKFERNFHAIIGRNNSGKTNLIDTIEFLSKLAQNLNIFNVIERMGGFDKILYFGAEERKIHFEVEIEKKRDLYSYELEFNERSILKERLLFNREPQLENFGKGKGRTFDYKENTYKDFSFDSKNIALNQLWDYERYKTVREFSKILNKYKIYKLIPEMMKEPIHAKKQFDAELHGEKIVQVLHSVLSSNIQSYQNIVETMKTIFDEIKNINSIIDERGLTNIEILERGFKTPFDITQISDGTLRFLAFLTIIQLEKKFSLFCFEEPELYLHPYLLEKLIELLKELDTQVIITTHSPQILNILEPKDLIIIYKKEGRSKCQILPTMPKILNKLRENGFLLGELWTMGEFDNA